MEKFINYFFIENSSNIQLFVEKWSLFTIKSAYIVVWIDCWIEFLISISTGIVFLSKFKETSYFYQFSIMKCYIWILNDRFSNCCKMICLLVFDWMSCGVCHSVWLSLSVSVCLSLSVSVCLCLSLSVSVSVSLTLTMFLSSRSTKLKMAS